MMTSNNPNTRLQSIMLLVALFLSCGLAADSASAQGEMTFLPAPGVPAIIHVSNSFTYECEGDACSQVVLSWEADSQQFKVQNNSDSRVKIDVSTYAGDSTIHVNAHTSDYLLVKTFNGPYRANYE